MYRSKDEYTGKGYKVGFGYHRDRKFFINLEYARYTYDQRNNKNFPQTYEYDNDSSFTQFHITEKELTSESISFSLGFPFELFGSGSAKSTVPEEKFQEKLDNDDELVLNAKL